MATKRHRLMQRRKTVGFSQEHLAERVGVDRSTVGRWEAGLTEPQPWLRPRLARVLQVSVEQLDALLEAAENGEDHDGDERAQLFRAQTPQVFRWQALMDAYAQPDEVLLRATDDASLVEEQGGRVGVVEGAPENFKITDRMDLRHAERILAERRR